MCLNLNGFDRVSWGPKLGRDVGNCGLGDDGVRGAGGGLQACMMNKIRLDFPRGVGNVLLTTCWMSEFWLLEVACESLV